MMKLIQHAKIVTAFSIVSLGLMGSAVAVPQDLIDGLGNESYQHREKAEVELAKWAKKEGEKGLDELSTLKKKMQSPEVISRLDNVISSVVIFKAIPGTRGYMGVSLTPMPGAVVITGVMPDTPADKAGFQPNDRIVWLDGHDLSKKNNHLNETMDFVLGYVKNKKAGEKLTVKLERNGEMLTKILKLADYDKEMGQLQEGQLDPFGDFNNNGGIEILPMRPQAVRPQRGNIRPQQNAGDPKQLLKFQLKIEKELMKNQEFPPEVKEMLRLHNERNQKRLEELKKELELQEKKAPEK